jgi:hypothetical protein
MADAVVDQVDGRMIRVGGQWLADFASCNYLGLDLDPEVLAGVPEYLARWGSHPSWARGSPARPCTSRSRPSSSSCWAGGRPLPAHPDPHRQRGPAGPGWRGDAAGRHPRPPDHPRRGRDRPGPRGHRAPVPLGRRPPRRAAPAGAGRGAPGAVHGRGQLDDRQPARPARLRRPGPRARRPAVRGRRPRLSGSSGSAPATTPARMGARATPWSAGSASPPTTWCWPPASPRPTRRCWPSWPSRPRSSGTSR